MEMDVFDLYFEGIVIYLPGVTIIICLIIY